MARPPSSGWSPPPDPADEPELLVLYVGESDGEAQAAAIVLANCYALLRARKDEEACNLVREHHDYLTAVLVQAELPRSLLSGVELARLLAGVDDGSDAPPYARDLPPLTVPVVVAVDPLDPPPAVAALPTVPNPVAPGPLSLAIADFHVARTLKARAVR